MKILCDKTWSFSEIDALYDAFSPLTPYGRKRKNSRLFITVREELEREYDFTESALRLMKSDQGAIDRIRFHLKRIPQLPDLAGGTLDAADVFLVKKFLFNFRAIVSMLDDVVISEFGMCFDSEELHGILRKGGDSDETFHISECHSEELRNVRAQISELNEELKRAESELNERLLETCGLDFRCRDFIVLDIEKTVGLDRTLVFIEPSDERKVIARPVRDKACLANLSRRDSLVAAEKREEKRILEELSAAINREAGKLEECAAALERFDIALARAELCVRFGLTRPILTSSENAGHEIVEGRLLSLEDRCRKDGETYRGLNANITGNIFVLRGSNLCGKTVSLKTCAFLQIAAQLGFFVPAEKFSTSVFDAVMFIGGNAESKAGLGSFGNEMVAISEALDGGFSHPLLFLDEPARTTNSREAVAIITGLTGYFAKRPNMSLFIATHYDDMPRIENVAYFRMKGLKSSEAANLSGKGTIKERAAKIHEIIEYEIVEDSGHGDCRDALHIARMLGMEEEIINTAEGYLEGRDIGRKPE